MKKHIITIAGNLGAGKTSTADGVAKILGYKRLSTGGIFRAVAESRNVTITEITKTAEQDDSFDKAVDQHIIDLNSSDNFVLDSRLAWHFIPTSFKVFLKLDVDTSVSRIQASKKSGEQSRASEISTIDIEVLKADMNKRYASERKRFKEFYNIDDHMAHENFDLIVDTKVNNLEEVINIIISAYRKWINE